MDLEGPALSEVSQAQKADPARFYSHEVPGGVTSTRTERWVPAGEGGKGEFVWEGDRVSAGEDEQVLEMDGEGGCTTVGMCFMPLSWTLQIGETVHLCHVYFNHNF